MSQLGMGEDFEDTHVPTALPFFDDKEIKKIKCGTLHTLCITADGKLWSWGCNDEHALGRSGDETVPMEVDLKEEPVDIACGASISACITKNNNVWSWGTFRNFNGVYGYNKGTRLQNVPKKVSAGVSGFKFEEINSGANFVCLLSKNKSIWTFGSNDFNELGRRTSERHKDSSLFPDQVFSGRVKKHNHKFRAVRAGLNHAIAINTDDEVYTWGSNIYGQLGNGTTESTRLKCKVDIQNIQDVAGGEHHTLFLTKGGELYGCGRNDQGQCGIPSRENFTTPQKINLQGVSKVRSYENFSICQVGNDLYSFGVSYSGSHGFTEEMILEPKKIPFDFPEIVDFCVGGSFTVVVTKNR